MFATEKTLLKYNRQSYTVMFCLVVLWIEVKVQLLEPACRHLFPCSILIQEGLCIVGDYCVQVTISMIHSRRIML